jgi:hypothetical protein
MRLTFWNAFLLAGLALTLGSTVRAAGQPAETPPFQTPSVRPASPSADGDAATTPVLFAGFIDKIFSPLNGVLGNRKAMLQVGFVGMLIALYIIWWRRH